MSDTSKREELIEEAATMLRHYGYGHLADGTEAVFDQAHTPTDDERMAAHKEAKRRYGRGEQQVRRRVAFEDGAAWAAGFRRTAVQEPSAEVPEADADPDTAFELGRIAGYDEAMREPQGEPTDAQVEAALIAYWGGEKNTHLLGSMERMRAALRAAYSTGK